MRAAQQRAAEIIDRAQDEAREVRRGADEYAAGVLIRLEGECIKALTSIKRGIDMLDERHRPRPTTAAGSSGADSIAVDAGEQAERRPAAMTSFNVAGLLHEPPGAVREVRLRDHYVSSARTSSSPDRSTPTSACSARTAASSLRGWVVRRCVGPAPAAPTPTSRTCTPHRRGVPAERRSRDRSPSHRAGGGRAETTLRIDEHHEIDLDSVLHDELALTEPMHPALPPDCPASAWSAGGRWTRGDTRPRRRRDRPAPRGLAVAPARPRSRRRRGSGHSPARSAVRLYCGVPSPLVKEFPRGRSQAKGIQGAPG